MNLSHALRFVRVRRRVYSLLESGASGDRLSQLIHIALIGLILVSVMTVILESVPSLNDQFGRIFLTIEIIAAIVFTVEYILRLWSCVEHAPLRGLSRWRARWVYARSASMVVDLIAIVPFFLAFFLPDDLRVMLIFRLIRFFKLARYSPGMRSLQEAIVEERRALLACLVILCGLMIVAAAAMHMAEATVQPNQFGSIPASMWWAIITLTTVGYGDVVPITVAGKIVAGVTALGGLVMLALPVGIIATSFAEVIRRREFVVTWAMITKVPMFAGMDAGVVGEVMDVMRSQLAEEGDVIFRKGDHGDRMYVIASGSVELLLPGGRVVRGEGEFFGENAVLGSNHREATVRALSRTRLLALDRADFVTLLDHEPSLRQHVEAAARAKQVHS
ncbi:MAG: cyclic nucleotide-gated ion channel [Beijerinckiaceae bacterium]